jgi:small subunit ribosomal protein S9
LSQDEETPETPETTPPAEDTSAPEAGSSSETDPGPAPAADDPLPEAGPASDIEGDEGAVPEAPASEEPVVVPPASAPQPPEGAPEVPAAAGPPQAGDEESEEEIELVPRVRPEIPGMDLIPDIVPEGDEFMDAEARAAAEAEAEARAEREREEREREEQSQPIADAAIDLAAGARYTATGKRKTAVARVILKPGSGTYLINGKGLDDFFPRETLRRVIRQPLETVGYESRMDVVARMHGGGVAAQAEALRHGISRALIVADPHLRGELKRRGFLTRDPRVKERKKAGLKKARKRPQFSKR